MMMKMKIKISVLIDEKLDNDLRLYQSDLIRKSKKSVSFSDTVNHVIIEGMQHIKNKSDHGSVN